MHRRKFGEEHDIALLKEVIAIGAHVSKRGSQMENFDAISDTLNKSGVLPCLQTPSIALIATDYL